MKAMQVIEKTTNSFYGRYGKGDQVYEVIVDRDSKHDDWYIQVYNDGGWLYDGWFDDSADATMAQAIDEALKGSELRAEHPKQTNKRDGSDEFIQ